MNLSESLEQISKELLALNVEFAVAGGLAASLYRDQPRLTDDVDLAVAFSVPVVKLEAILTKLELSPTRVSEAQLKGGPKHLVKGKLSPIAILVGRAKDKIGIDLLLPNLSWVETALKRAVLALEMSAYREGVPINPLTYLPFLQDEAVG